MLCFRKLKLAVFKTMQQQRHAFLYFMKEIITATSKEIPWSNNDIQIVHSCVTERTQAELHGETWKEV